MSEKALERRSPENDRAWREHQEKLRNLPPEPPADLHTKEVFSSILPDTKAKLKDQMEKLHTLLTQLREREMSFPNFVSPENTLGLSTTIRDDGNTFSSDRLETVEDAYETANIRLVWLVKLQGMMETGAKLEDIKKDPTVFRFLQSPEGKYMQNMATDGADANALDAQYQLDKAREFRTQIIRGDEIAQEWYDKLEGTPLEWVAEQEKMDMGDRTLRKWREFANSMLWLDSLAMLATGAGVGRVAGTLVSKSDGLRNLSMETLSALNESQAARLAVPWVNALRATWTETGMQSLTKWGANFLMEIAKGFTYTEIARLAGGEQMAHAVSYPLMFIPWAKGQFEASMNIKLAENPANFAQFAEWVKTQYGSQDRLEQAIVAWWTEQVNRQGSKIGNTEAETFRSEAKKAVATLYGSHLDQSSPVPTAIGVNTPSNTPSSNTLPPSWIAEGTGAIEAQSMGNAPQNMGSVPQAVSQNGWNIPQNPKTIPLSPASDVPNIPTDTATVPPAQTNTPTATASISANQPKQTNPSDTKQSETQTNPNTLPNTLTKTPNTQPDTLEIHTEQEFESFVRTVFEEHGAITLKNQNEVIQSLLHKWKEYSKLVVKNTPNTPNETGGKLSETGNKPAEMRWLFDTDTIAPIDAKELKKALVSYVDGMRTVSELMDGVDDWALMSSNSLFLAKKEYPYIPDDFDISIDRKDLGKAWQQLEKLKASGKIDNIHKKAIVGHDKLYGKGNNVPDADIPALMDAGNFKVVFDMKTKTGSPIETEFFVEDKGLWFTQIDHMDRTIESVSIKGKEIKYLSEKDAAEGYALNLLDEGRKNEVEGFTESLRKSLKDGTAFDPPKAKDGTRVLNLLVYLEGMGVSKPSELASFAEKTANKYREQSGGKMSQALDSATSEKNVEALKKELTGVLQQTEDLDSKAQIDLPDFETFRKRLAEQKRQVAEIYLQASEKPLTQWEKDDFLGKLNIMLRDTKKLTDKLWQDNLSFPYIYELYKFQLRFVRRTIERIETGK